MTKRAKNQVRRLMRLSPAEKERQEQRLLVLGHRLVENSDGTVALASQMPAGRGSLERISLEGVVPYVNALSRKALIAVMRAVASVPFALDEEGKYWQAIYDSTAPGDDNSTISIWTAPLSTVRHAIARRAAAGGSMNAPTDSWLRWAAEEWNAPKEIRDYVEDGIYYEPDWLVNEYRGQMRLPGLGAAPACDCTEAVEEALRMCTCREGKADLGSEEFPQDDEPAEGDITTSDHHRWYQYGKLYHTGDEEGLKQKMDADRFWPNVWAISDHGNAHLMTLDGLGEDDSFLAQLRTIKVLFRQSDTMTLWGIPYNLRPGQQPADILRGQREREEKDTALSRSRLPANYPQLKNLTADWIYLGGPGWFGSMPAEKVKMVKAFIEHYDATDDVPGGPNEWNKITPYTGGGR